MRPSERDQQWGIPEMGGLESEAGLCDVYIDFDLRHVRVTVQVPNPISPRPIFQQTGER
jgi:hypothetical protein